jgi:hypothetical protein
MKATSRNAPKKNGDITYRLKTNQDQTIVRYTWKIYSTFFGTEKNPAPLY